jgi:hypothetical protein
MTAGFAVLAATGYIFSLLRHWLKEPLRRLVIDTR